MLTVQTKLSPVALTGEVPTFDVECSNVESKVSTSECECELECRCNFHQLNQAVVDIPESDPMPPLRLEFRAWISCDPRRSYSVYSAVQSNGHMLFETDETATQLYIRPYAICYGGHPGNYNYLTVLRLGAHRALIGDLDFVHLMSGASCTSNLTTSVNTPADLGNQCTCQFHGTVVYYAYPCLGQSTSPLLRSTYEASLPHGIGECTITVPNRRPKCISESCFEETE